MGPGWEISKPLDLWILTCLYRQVCVKFKVFSRICERSSFSFQGLQDICLHHDITFIFGAFKMFIEASLCKIQELLKAYPIYSFQGLKVNYFHYNIQFDKR